MALWEVPSNDLDELSLPFCYASAPGKPGPTSPSCYSPIHSSKRVLPTVNLGPPNWTKSRTFTLRFKLAL